MVNPDTHAVPLTYEYDVALYDAVDFLYTTERLKLAFRSVCETDTLTFNAATPPSSIDILTVPYASISNRAFDELEIDQAIPGCETSRVWTSPEFTSVDGSTTVSSLTTGNDADFKQFL